MSSSKRDESKPAKAEVADAQVDEAATSAAAASEPPEEEKVAAPAPAPVEPEPLAAVVGYTTVVPVPGSDGPRSQQELDAGQR